MRYYIYLGSTDKRKSITEYDTEDDANEMAVLFRKDGYEAYVCEYGYPFA